MSLNGFRRAVAIALLTLTPASAAESVVGLLRDGFVHHEPVAAAAAHVDKGLHHSEHGHEDPVPNHQHGTPADHCTHVHGTAFASRVFSLSFATSISAQRQANCTIHRSWILLEEFDPPRA